MAKSNSFTMFMGKKVKPKNNSVPQYYDESEYIQLLIDAENAGLTPSKFKSILSQPCQCCGNDKVMLELIKKDMRKKSNGHSVHLFIYQSSDINKHTELTELKIDCILSSMLRVGASSKVYTPKETHKYKEGKKDATITVFKDGIRGSTVNCIIKENTIYPNENI